MLKNQSKHEARTENVTAKIVSKSSWSLPAQFMWLIVRWRWGGGEGRLIICPRIYLTILKLQNKAKTLLCFCCHQQNCASEEEIKLFINRSLQSAPLSAICNQQPRNKEGQSQHGESSLLWRAICGETCCCWVPCTCWEKSWETTRLLWNFQFLSSKSYFRHSAITLTSLAHKTVYRIWCYNIRLEIKWHQKLMALHDFLLKEIFIVIEFLYTNIALP